MATDFRVAENSYRIGCGRYIQDVGAVCLIGEEIQRLKCSHPFFIGGHTALGLTYEKITKSLESTGIKGIFYEYSGYCDPEHCKRIMASEDFSSCDCLVGVGGGNCMDAAKYCASMSNKPVINIPTSSATCAAFTPLSVMYNGLGQALGSVHHKCEVNAILADMDILSKQPLRLLISGVYDSLAKQYEISQRLLGREIDEIDIGLYASYELSRLVTQRLDTLLETCCNDMKKGECTKAVYDVVYTLIAMTGVVSGLARGCNQSALAHKIYETTRTLHPEASRQYLHGELVALGSVVQLSYNGDTEEKDKLTESMKKHGVSAKMSELGLAFSDSDINEYYERLVASTAMSGTSDEEKKCLKKALEEIK